jgi:hypothetical protein
MIHISKHYVEKNMALNKDTNVHSVHHIDESRLDPLNPDSIDPANTDPADDSRGYERSRTKPSVEDKALNKQNIDDRNKKFANDISNPDAGI